MKDKIFTIYKFNIEKKKFVEGDIFNEGQHLEPKKYASKELFFESFIPEKEKFMDLWEEVTETKKDEETIEKDSHNNRILAHKDNIIVFAIQANKSKKIYDEDWGSHPEGNYPPCYVIIDNQKGHQFLAIEQAAMDPEKTAGILRSSFNAKLMHYGYRIHIMRLKRNMSFLQAVYHIKDKLHDRVSRLTFAFDKNMEEKQRLGSKFMHALTEWIGKFADCGQLSTEITDDEKLKNREIEQDLELMAGLCSQNCHYNLIVKFAHFGLYKFGQDVKAQFGLEPDILDDFVNEPEKQPVQVPMYEEDKEEKTTLPQWLENVNKLYSDYDEEPLSVKKRKRTGRL